MDSMFGDDDDSWMEDIPLDDSQVEEDPNPSKPEEPMPSVPQNHLQILEKWFGHKTFKPIQWEIIKAVTLNKQDQVIICISYDF